MRYTSIKDLRKICQESKEGWTQRNWFDKYITRNISIYITYFFIKLGVTPNQVTILTLVFGLISGLLIVTGNKIYWIVGFLVLYLCIMLDAVDGELARFYKKTTELGSYLDLFVGYFLYDYIVLCMALSIFFETSNYISIILGLIIIIATSLSAKNFLYRENILLKFKNLDYNKHTYYYKKYKVRGRVLQLFKSILDYCNGFSLFWAIVGIVDIYITNIKFVFFIIYTILICVGFIRNTIESIQILKDL